MLPRRERINLPPQEQLHVFSVELAPGSSPSISHVLLRVMPATAAGRRSSHCSHVAGEKHGISPENLLKAAGATAAGGLRGQGLSPRVAPPLHLPPFSRDWQFSSAESAL